ncbi:MarR family winged helix-turn-helix transcriptional regulator [Methylocystis sp. ATCC 49242]|uniref:MarR family winged helix-turn-helix transcriptional regulator n=1 Tax=Methylocystis sp. ATCC 49242 TaxID=622637 RepID=UPI0001F88018|nr:MarR family winged helix-turn-helix transcriptional regulator [Methylocystis sp. ATCC 49242]
MSTGGPSAAITKRLIDGLERVSAALRADRWRALETAPVNPTQAQILGYLAGHEGARVGAIAAHLGASQPTATDSIAALEKKGLVERRPDAQDRRATTVAATERGLALSGAIEARAGATERALQALGAQEQSQLLGLVIRLIRNLQIEGAIPPQRMCVSCKYFRPYAHDDAEAPHHCALVDAAFGAPALRLDCADHEAAQDQEEVWNKFLGVAERDAARPAAP